ncbi:lipopolysaccharide assembly protein LapA domain-containing protein [uncultured Pseudodesulfovibrio sp.]|uniref:lipopolysaccharide assembly protein LapA domain-containing protein n=1 Tax=uncultured Pseudodesulfovibrio sp. TaxID=2035858 RepID=UPI0029C994B7|nr:lipopolysaccharide assembly protein LapA domain-containing protein [uncultured Pseudodesulfovibrio sp.]
MDNTPSHIDQNQSQTGMTTWQKVRLGAIATLVVLWIIFLLQNTEQTQVSFLWFTFATSRILLLLGTLVVGAIFGALLTYRLCAKNRKSRPKPPSFS